jgi:hypothetical protein
LTDDVVVRFNGDAGEGFIPVGGATRARQTVPSRAVIPETNAS